MPFKKGQTVWIKLGSGRRLPRTVLDVHNNYIKVKTPSGTNWFHQNNLSDDPYVGRLILTKSGLPVKILTKVGNYYVAKLRKPETAEDIPLVYDLNLNLTGSPPVYETVIGKLCDV